MRSPPNPESTRLNTLRHLLSISSVISPLLAALSASFGASDERAGKCPRKIRGGENAEQIIKGRQGNINGVLAGASTKELTNATVRTPG